MVILNYISRSFLAIAHRQWRLATADLTVKLRKHRSLHWRTCRWPPFAIFRRWQQQRRKSPRVFFKQFWISSNSDSLGNGILAVSQAMRHSIGERQRSSDSQQHLQFTPLVAGLLGLNMSPTIAGIYGFCRSNWVHSQLHNNPDKDAEESNPISRNRGEID